MYEWNSGSEFLVELNLAGQPIVNEGIVALCRSPHLARLRRLDLYTRREVDQAAWQVYQERFQKK